MQFASGLSTCAAKRAWHPSRSLLSPGTSSTFCDTFKPEGFRFGKSRFGISTTHLCRGQVSVGTHAEAFGSTSLRSGHSSALRKADSYAAEGWLRPSRARPSIVRSSCPVVRHGRSEAIDNERQGERS